jgi:hypothetical protein
MAVGRQHTRIVRLDLDLHEIVSVGEPWLIGHDTWRLPFRVAERDLPSYSTFGVTPGRGGGAGRPSDWRRAA